MGIVHCWTANISEVRTSQTGVLTALIRLVHGGAAQILRVGEVRWEELTRWFRWANVDGQTLNNDSRCMKIKVLCEGFQFHTFALEFYSTLYKTVPTNGIAYYVTTTTTHKNDATNTHNINVAGYGGDLHPEQVRVRVTRLGLRGFRIRVGWVRVRVRVRVRGLGLGLGWLRLGDWPYRHIA